MMISSKLYDTKSSLLSSHSIDGAMNQSTRAYTLMLEDGDIAYHARCKLRYHSRKGSNCKNHADIRGRERQLNSTPRTSNQSTIESYIDTYQRRRRTSFMIMGVETESAAMHNDTAE